jgi:hypothetical protein
MKDTAIVQVRRSGVETAAAGLMLVAALTLALASIIHFGIVIPLGIATVNDPFPGARIPEAIIAVVVAIGASGVLLKWRGSWWLALTALLFAIAGVIVGLRFVLLTGFVTRPGDLVYHAALMVLLLVALGLLLLPRRRQRLGGHLA